MQVGLVGQFFALPPEAQLHCAAFFDPEDLGVLERICRAFRVYASSDAVWQACMRRFGVSRQIATKADGLAFFTKACSLYRRIFPSVVATGPLSCQFGALRQSANCDTRAVFGYLETHLAANDLDHAKTWLATFATHSDVVQFIYEYDGRTFLAALLPHGLVDKNECLKIICKLDYFTLLPIFYPLENPERCLQMTLEAGAFSCFKELCLEPAKYHILLHQALKVVMQTMTSVRDVFREVGVQVAEFDAFMQQLKDTRYDRCVTLVKQVTEIYQEGVFRVANYLADLQYKAHYAKSAKERFLALKKFEWFAEQAPLLQNNGLLAIIEFLQTKIFELDATFVKP